MKRRYVIAVLLTITMTLVGCGASNSEENTAAVTEEVVEETAEQKIEESVEQELSDIFTPDSGKTESKPETPQETTVETPEETVEVPVQQNVDKGQLNLEIAAVAVENDYAEAKQVYVEIKEADNLSTQEKIDAIEKFMDACADNDALFEQMYYDSEIWTYWQELQCEELGTKPIDNPGDVGLPDPMEGVEMVPSTGDRMEDMEEIIW